MTINMTRRSFLKVTGVTGAAFLLGGCAKNGDDAETLSFIDRIKGTPLTDLPQIEDAWILSDGNLSLDLAKLPELTDMGGAVRIEGDLLADPVLVLQGEDGSFYAFKNVCSHAGRMIDPVAGSMTLECCSLSSSTYDYEGNVLSGPAKEALQSYPVSVEEGNLLIELS